MARRRARIRLLAMLVAALVVCPVGAETLVVSEAASLVALERPAEAIGLLRPLEGRDNIAAQLVRNHALAAAGADEAPDKPSESSIAQAPIAVSKRACAAGCKMLES